MKKTEESNVQKFTELPKGAIDKRSNVIGFAQFKEQRATDEYRKALEMVVANAQKADW
ncbi:hypothetical protein ALO95_00601 [Pseudomonas syringae pv. antirrhini]|uniref:Uncharacterized protein n=1 Tax=Pseudomonas syringae pv. antirrhini TaxID=251702 RepID=A0A0P9IZ70_9PSED|nr:hypothetical protein [Pseudomonas syringae group genomosp. 3]KPW42557.1 Unknown protein sequence [Pseudomonas syringae pv. antirrhini]KPW42102.1 Unknown protein sequence [Pseudomonas syringae pv. apii]RMP34352.1 hypothetical protein ALQ24_04222 [Pseudomonas syringae pv. antirrhini]RMP37413.1 hypothetical protein ALQ23_00002 [Pseudomonas syringae pv. antirrhini]RMW29147.1 hypothetical protein ALO95_00601 [Pseudomonas syringae pv. antirrhini]